MTESTKTAYRAVLAAGCKPFDCDCLAEDCPLCNAFGHVVPLGGSVDSALLSALPQVAALLREAAVRESSPVGYIGLGMAAAEIESWLTAENAASQEMSP